MIIAEPFGGPGWRAVIGLRDRVLRRPLGLRLHAADLAGERDGVHLALWSGPARLVGCALLLPPDREGIAVLRQMAVADADRGRGSGRQLVEAAEAVARDRGAVRVRLAARDTAVGFYRRAGFVIDGPPFTSVTLLHRPMTKPLARG